MTKSQATPAATIGEIWKKELAAEGAPPEQAEPVPMTFAGLPCKVRPLGLEFYIRSGRMPIYLARIAMSEGKKEVVEKELEGVTVDDVLAGQAFQRVAVCRVLAEPRVMDVPEGAAPEGVITYMELAERRPAFVDGVFMWIIAGCPAVREGEEGTGLDAEALETFPKGERGGRRDKPRHKRKANRKDAVAASPK